MIIGIAGGSRSGKTTLARGLAETRNCPFVSGDDYFFGPSTFPVVAGRPDYERVEAVDWNRFAETVLKQRGEVEHRGDVVVESFLLLAHRHMRSIVDISFFVELSQEERIRRRREQQPDMELDYITNHIMARHNRLVEPSKILADVILDGQLSVPELRQQVLGHTAVHELYRSPSQPNGV